jgi:hypothetical protein
MSDEGNELEDIEKTDQDKGDECLTHAIQRPRLEEKLKTSSMVAMEEKNFIEDVIHFLANKGHHLEMKSILRLAITTYGTNLANDQKLELRVHLSVAFELLAQAVI